ncbi:MAG: GNAT family N-acetyltransferase [Geodermatophilaceae bacterium]|nr:GNAT family N-acetyltransferase [Geodermatophilaceae bacterium]MDQ3475020.1 GNAT family N-acetyltransferase [Actinomycetota bacterium]
MSAYVEPTLLPSGSGSTGGFVVTRSSAEETVALRRAVLRPHLTIEQMAVTGDRNPDTAYLAVRPADGDRTVVGCVRLEPVPCPWPQALQEPAHVAWQLRAMATDPGVRGTGLGRLLVEAAVEYVARRGGDLIWCNARLSAERFYLRLGFAPVTTPFPLPDVPEDHVGMVRRVLDVERPSEAAPQLAGVKIERPSEAAPQLGGGAR